jgi:hypothetical protein
VLPGWAGTCAPRLGFLASARPEFASGPGRLPTPAFQPRPGLLIRLGWLLRVFRPDWAGAAFPGRITTLEAGFHLSRAEIYPHRRILLIRHQLQRLVPVLGRLQARTGISSAIVCWSWDAPWLRPAYSTSPTQPYPQEEDKTDNMVILKTTARRRSQGRRGQPRWDKPMTMTPATVPSTVPG